MRGLSGMRAVDGERLTYCARVLAAAAHGAIPEQPAEVSGSAAHGCTFGCCGERFRTSVAAGASLVEVLVALAVLSIGLLGIAQVLVNGMRASHSALLRTQAVNLVADMAERIRANPGGGAAYDCASYTSGPTVRGCAADTETTPANCTAAELAEDDLARWQAAARAALPLAAGACAADVRHEAGSVVDSFRVSLAWQDGGASQAVSEQTDVVVVRPVIAGPL